MKLLLGYSKKQIEISLPDHHVKGVLTPKQPNIELSERDILTNALATPINAAPLTEIVQPGEKIAIVTGDITRPMPTAKVLPWVV